MGILSTTGVSFMRYGGLIVAVAFAAIAAVVVLKMSGAPAPVTPVAGVGGALPVPQDIKGTAIYVAAKPIPIGTVITQEMVAPQPWPEHLLPKGAISAKEGSPTMVGMVARGAFQQNEPMIQSKLAKPNDPNFLAGALPKGMRVASIPLNEVDGIAGFLFPGDYVDVLYTHEVDRWETPPASNGAVAAPQKNKATFTETLLTNVKVMAVDQRAAGDNATDKNGNLIIPKSASLMVSQEDAQRLRLAQKTGTVSLALRSLVDRESEDPHLLTAAKDISQVAPDDGNGAVSDGGIRIVRGAPQKNKEIESTGIGIARGVAP